jgi:hypothetical protein
VASISADGGTTWYEVQGLRSLSNSWTKYTVDLDAAIAARGLNYTSSFKIRFNQYDNYGISTDGIAIDDILIAQSISSNLTLSLPVQAVTEGASDVIATLNVTPVQTSALTVTLSANTADVLLPATVTVPANTNQITIPVTIVDNPPESARVVQEDALGKNDERVAHKEVRDVARQPLQPRDALALGAELRVEHDLVELWEKIFQRLLAVLVPEEARIG